MDTTIKNELPPNYDELKELPTEHQIGENV